MTTRQFIYFCDTLRASLKYDADLCITQDIRNKEITITNDRDPGAFFASTFREIFAEMPARLFSFRVTDGKIIITAV